MKHTLYLIGHAPGHTRLDVLRGIRDAVRATGGEISLSDANAIYGYAQADGFALVCGSDDRDFIARAERRLAERGGKVAVDLDVEAFKAERAAGPRTPEEILNPTPPPAPPATPSTAAYETAMVLMAISDGNPLRACANAKNLARTTEAKVFEDVIAAALKTFPWLRDALVESGLI